MPLEKYGNSDCADGKDHADRQLDFCRSPNHHQALKSRNQLAQLLEADEAQAEVLREDEAFQEVDSAHQEAEAQARAASVEVVEEEHREEEVVHEVEGLEDEDRECPSGIPWMHLEFRTGSVRAKCRVIMEGDTMLCRVTYWTTSTKTSRICSSEDMRLRGPIASHIKPIHRAGFSEHIRPL